MRRLASLLLVAIVLISLSARGVTQDLGDLYRSASASVAVIRAKGREVSRDGVMRFGEIGSGVLISREGRVVTASHVVHGMEEITCLRSGTESGDMSFNGFDLLTLDGQDVMSEPWSARRKRLEDVFA